MSTLQPSFLLTPPTFYFVMRSWPLRHMSHVTHTLFLPHSAVANHGIGEVVVRGGSPGHFNATATGVGGVFAHDLTTAQAGIVSTG